MPGNNLSHTLHIASIKERDPEIDGVPSDSHQLIGIVLSHTRNSFSIRSKTLQGTKISFYLGTFGDDFPFTKVGYVSCQQGSYIFVGDFFLRAGSLQPIGSRLKTSG